MNYKPLVKGVGLLLCIILLASATDAIGVSPARKVIDYEPNLKTTVTQHVFNNEQKDMRISIYVRGALEEYVTIDQPQLRIGKDQDKAPFSYTLSIPGEISIPGLHSGEIVIIELPEASVSERENVVLAMGAVLSEVYLRVPYPKKYAESKLVIESSNKEKPVRFVMPIFNYGTEKIFKATARIEILGSTYETIAEVDTQQISLEKGAEGKLVAQWFDASVHPGKYHAKVTIDYDGERIDLEKDFSIGDFSIEIVDIASDSFRLGAISAIDIQLKNLWNNKIDEVYGILTVTNNEGSRVGTAKTASISLDALARDKITAYWDTRDVPPGMYDLNIELHYDGKTSTKLIEANINIDSFKTSAGPVGRVIVGQASAKRNTMLYLLILILIVVNISWFAYFVKKKGK